MAGELDDTKLPANTSEAIGPDRFAANLLRALEMSGQIMATLFEDKSKREGVYTVAGGVMDAAKVFSPIVQFWANQPQRLSAKQSELAKNLIDLWGRTYLRFLGEQTPPLAQPPVHDVRFKDRDWDENPFFDFLKQAYLITSAWAEGMIKNAATVDEHTKRRAEFYLNQIATALSPSNFPFSNPEVFRATVSTNAQNLALGMQQLLEDLRRSQELLRIRQTDVNAFEVGNNIAVTPGKVIHQNDIAQLIQYSPSTEEVYRVPLLIVPPWINKYYILDLNPHKSFIKWLVDQGFTVFIVSWVNPDKSLAHKTFENYMREGVLESIEAVIKITGEPQINALGYCIGGTLLATTLAYMAATGDERVKSASFLAAQKDFTQAGDLLVFIDEDQLKSLDQLMTEKGYLDGERMSTVFNLLRPKDLIWPYIVNNYLLGKQPIPFDLLYWNADTTRMTPANHSFYLHEFYLNNKLSKGELEIAGVKLDLAKVTLPVYELATREDHISPAQSVLTGAKLFGGPVRFVLAGSGHIAGIVNPPAKPKYMHWVLEGANGIAAMPTVDAFISHAREIAGSWWPDYAQWLAAYSGEKVPARRPETGPLPVIEDAPGSYVRG